LQQPVFSYNLGYNYLHKYNTSISSILGATLMSSEIDELTVNYEDGGELVSKELDKVILTRGAWSTIIFKYQDLNRTKGEFGPDKYSIRRYQKRNGEYQYKSKFNISSKDQARKIMGALEGWIGEDEDEK
jgi:hypothetical protein